MFLFPHNHYSRILNIIIVISLPVSWLGISEAIMVKCGHGGWPCDLDNFYYNFRVASMSIAQILVLITEMLNHRFFRGLLSKTALSSLNFAVNNIILFFSTLLVSLHSYFLPACILKYLGVYELVTSGVIIRNLL